MWFCLTNKNLAQIFIFGLGICKLPQHQLHPIPLAGGFELYIRKFVLGDHLAAPQLLTLNEISCHLIQYMRGL